MMKKQKLKKSAYTVYFSLLDIQDDGPSHQLKGWLQASPPHTP